ncbi:MAG: hypothetical protein ACMG6E_03490, partial [Candidatus Roizmanbacteria bacterium]
MKNQLVIIVVVAVLGIGALALSQRYWGPDSKMENKGSEANESAKEQSAEKEQGESMEKIDDKMMGSRYVKYSKAAFDKASST